MKNIYFHPYSSHFSCVRPQFLFPLPEVQFSCTHYHVFYIIECFSSQESNYIKLWNIFCLIIIFIVIAFSIVREMIFCRTNCNNDPIQKVDFTSRHFFKWCTELITWLACQYTSVPWTLKKRARWAGLAEDATMLVGEHVQRTGFLMHCTFCVFFVHVVANAYTCEALWVIGIDQTPREAVFLWKSRFRLPALRSPLLYNA